MSATSVEDKMSGRSGLEAGSLCQAPHPLLSERKRKGKGEKKKKSSMLLYVQRDHTDTGMASQGRPPRLSHSS